ncbi:hypothetical protein ACQEVB_27950 [Pseudonocardia sp. CA-107938]|uniref:hypothetical protein n=1 Tax=Pseudonocardia sp. CA-107938 TaxID=3240021 RepID=UPI003D8B1E84
MMKRMAQAVVAALLVGAALTGTVSTAALAVPTTGDGTRVTDPGDTGGGTRVTGVGTNSTDWT